MNYLVNGDSNGGIDPQACNCWIDVCGTKTSGCTGNVCAAQGCNRLGCCSEGGKSVPQNKIFPNK